MKEIFDGLLVMLDEMKRAAIQSCDYYAARNYQRIQAKIIELQAKYNESLEKELATAKNTEMTALEYLQKYYRMCDSAGKSSCTGCLIHIRKGNMMCRDFQKKYPEQAISIVQEWHKNNPQKTRKDDFLEKYPNALRCADGTPYVCAHILGYVRNRTECIRSDKYGLCNFDRYSNACRNCWREPLSEEGDK